MKLLLLTRSPEAHGNRRLAESARALGWDLALVDSLAPMVLPSSGVVLLQGEPLQGIDAVLPRFGPELQAAGLVVLRALEAAGARSLASAEAFARARDKAVSAEIFRRAGLRVPETAIVSDPAHAAAAISAVGGCPLIVKPVQGWRGAGLRLFTDAAAARVALEGEADARRPLLVQRFVGEAGGASLRLLVLDGELVAAARFRAAAGEFRSNAAAGGKAEACRPDPGARHAAIEAVASLGLRSGGVDLLETPSGPLLLEVNAAPGFRALEAATGLDLATPLLLALATVPIGDGPQ